VNVVRRKRHGLGRLAGAVVVALAVAVGVPSAWAAESASNDKQSPSPSLAGPIAAGADDVELLPGGVLLGRVVAANTGPTRENMAARRAVAVRAGQVLAETGVDAQGRFALGPLSPGAVELVVTGPEGAQRRSCRLWTAGTAPPASVAEVRMLEGGPTIRGQVRFIRLGFPRALAVAGIAAGAIAVPVIHNDIQHSHQPPHSP
jgi:hypothetical protein